MCRVIPRAIPANKSRGNLKLSRGHQAHKHQNSGQTKRFGDKFDFPCANIFSCGFSVLRIVVFVFTERETPSTANGTTGSSPVQCSSGTTQTCTKESCFSARKTLAKSWSHGTVVAEPLQRNFARDRVEEKSENGAGCIYGASR